jgi:transposase
VLSVEDWAEIVRLHRAEGLPVKVIARTLGVARNTVRSALASDGPPKYERSAKGSVADGFEPRIRELLAAFPSMPATVIGERIGWPYSIRTLSGRVAELRPLYLPPDPASRTSYDAGELAQCDFWFPDIELPVGFGQSRTAKRLPVLTMATGYSRWLSAVLVHRVMPRTCSRAGGRSSRSWGRCPGRWCGTGRAPSAGGGRVSRS